MKNKTKTLSENFKNPTEESQKEIKYISLAHKYMTAHFPDHLIQALQYKVAE